MHGYGLTDQSIPISLYELPAADGVAVFFVLSGFLIGRILIKTLESAPINRQTIIEFWIRRWFRTLPTYYLVLSALAGYSLIHGHVNMEGLWPYFLFSQNLAYPHPGFFPEAWSLSVEEWFYFLIPLVLYILVRRLSLPNRSAFFWTIAVTIVVVTVFRVWKVSYFGYQDIGSWDSNLRKQVVTRMDSLMFGVWGAYLSIYCVETWHRYKKTALILALLLLIVAKVYYFNTESIWFLNYVQLTLMSLITLLTLPFLSTYQQRHGLLIKSITFISLISYSMYLLNHTVILEIIMPMLRQPNAWVAETIFNSSGWANYAIYWILTTLMSWLVYRFFEVKITACREPVIRWWKKKSI